MDGEGLGAQVATLAGELGLDPPARPMERKSLSAPRSPHLGSRHGDRSPRGEVREPSGGKKGVESQMSRHMLPSPAFWTPPAARAPPASAQGATLVAAIREKLKEARARLGRRPEMVARSVGGEGTRIDCRRIGNGRTGQSAQERPGREFRRHGEEEPTKARTRGQEKRELVLKRRKGGVQQHRRGPGERRRFQGETDRRLEAGSATSLRAGDDAPPTGATSRGLRDGRRSAGERSGGCLPPDCSKAECREQARVQEHSRIAVFSRSRGSADAWTSGECRRRPDPEIPRSGSGGTGGREMVTRTSSRTAARSSSVNSVIWSSGSDDQSRAGFPPIAPEPEDTESQAKARGGTATPGPPPGGARSKKKNPEQISSGSGRNEDREGTTSHETRNGGTKLEEQRKTKQVAVPAEQARLIVCGVKGPQCQTWTRNSRQQRLHGKVPGPPWKSRRLEKPFRAKTQSE